jgi:phosphoglycerate dehydrogenase-like enzyme
MKVLYLRAPSGLDGAYPDFVKAIEGRFLFEVYDPDRPPAEQFEGVGVVVDPGGAVGTRALIDAALAADVKLWQVTTNGTDHVDVAYFLEQGLPLANSPGRLSAVPLAEHVVMLILCFAKNLDHNRAAGWQRRIGEELAGKRLGLIGFGASAREVARRAWPLGMRIMAIDPVEFTQEELDEFHVEFLGKPEQLDHLLAEADYLSLHLHLNSATRHLIDRRVFGLMKESAVLINIARGELVDEEALIEALQQGQIKGAAIDAFAEEPLSPDHPLQQLDNAILTPHCSAYTPGTPRRRMQAAAANVDRIAQGLPPGDLVTELVR